MPDTAAPALLLFGRVTPVLRVRDIVASRDYYVRAWALEMQVEDLDGNVLRIGSDPRPGEPDGEWLDMHGRRWLNGKPVE
jgi:hypothetical protein